MDTPTLNKVHVGDCIETMREWPDGFVQTCITSPPYWGLRDYGESGQIGLEDTLPEYIERIVAVCDQVWRVLRDDGTFWLNLGDAYCGGGRGGGTKKQKSNSGSLVNRSAIPPGLKPKDLIGIPWRVALALQERGWYLRSDIIWHKLNPMPESVTDRPTSCHESIFLLTKSPTYYYDAEAIREQSVRPDWVYETAGEGTTNADRGDGGKTQRKSDKQRGHSRRHAGFNDRWDSMSKEEQAAAGRNKRDVWTIATKPYSGAHFATFPSTLIEPCVMAGSKAGDVVLDPFMGSGTVAEVAHILGRNWVGCELNPDYVELSLRRLQGVSEVLPFSW